MSSLSRRPACLKHDPLLLWTRGPSGLEGAFGQPPNVIISPLHTCSCLAMAALTLCPCMVRGALPDAVVSPSISSRFSGDGVRAASLRPRSQRRRQMTVRALDLDQDTLVAVGVGLAGLAFGIGVPVFYETQVKNSELRGNDQPCFPCKGSGSQTCRFCVGAGNVTVELGGGEQEVSRCINCEGSGSIVCTTCQGSGLQPRYLDRREFKDDD